MPVTRITSVLAFAAALTTLLLGGCKSEGATGPGPTPTAVRAETGNNQTGVAGGALPVTLSVVVTDKSGAPVRSRRVDWDVGAGSGTVSPTSSTTDARGIATTVWTLGTTAGTARVTAQVNGVSPASFTATVLPGPAASVVAVPGAAYLGVGDTLRLRATVRDQYGNEVVGQAVDFTSLDAATASVNSAGLVTAIAQGAARVVATASGRADTVPVAVGAAGTAPCGPVPVQQLTLGQVVDPTASAGNALTACVSAPATGSAEFALTLISTGTSFGTTTVADVLGIGTNSPVTSALLSPSMVFPSADLPDVQATAATITPHQRFEQRLRETERRELGSLVDDARDTFGRTAFAAPAVRATAVDSGVSVNPPRAALTAVNVGDEIKLNANANVACSSADMRTGRVAAVGTNAIIVSDNENPSGGYTDSEFSTILATFDTLVYPIDTTAFGAPSNISKYGKIILFYTKAVNQLTPASASFTIGGFFFARDLYPKTARNGLSACSASNENEMFYLLVPDPNGTINGNRRDKTDVTRLNLTTIAHELQHLINSSRRIYVNTGAATNETVWLDEGLAHLAEEQLYFRIANYSSRQNLVLTDVNGTRATDFSTYASQNFSRFYNFLINPEINSPYAPNDSLATRGAIWNFLRFAAARQGASGEAGFLRQLVNSRVTGVDNLQQVLSGGAFADYLRDWTVSLIADDYSAATRDGLGARYTNPAWNFRSIYPGLRLAGGAALGVYPIQTRALISNVPQRITLAGGTSSYVRFSVPAGQRALISLSSNGALPPGSLRYALVRLR